MKIRLDDVTEPMMNTQKAADIIGVTDRYVRTLCREGILEGAKHYGRDSLWLIPERSVYKYKQIRDALKAS